MNCKTCNANDWSPTGKCLVCRSVNLRIKRKETYDAKQGEKEALYDEARKGKITIIEVCGNLGISQSTFRRYDHVLPLKREQIGLSFYYDMDEVNTTWKDILSNTKTTGDYAPQKRKTVNKDKTIERYTKDEITQLLKDSKDGMLNIKQLSKAIGLSITVIKSMVYDERLPAWTIGNETRFDYNQVKRRLGIYLQDNTYDPEVVAQWIEQYKEDKVKPERKTMWSSDSGGSFFDR